MRWTTMLAHLWWASAVTVTCAIEPVVPVGLATVVAVYLYAARGEGE